MDLHPQINEQIRISDKYSHLFQFKPHHDAALIYELLSNYDNLEYFGDITLGAKKTEKTTFRVVFDTGSSLLWVAHFKSTFAKKHKSLNCMVSKTCIATSKGFMIVYGAGNVFGKVVTEELQIGHVKLPKFELLEALQTPGLDKLQADGVLGIGKEVAPNFQNLLEVLKKGKHIKHKMFGIDISGVKMRKGASRIIFGDWHRDIAKNGNELHWEKVEPKAKYWEVKVSNMHLGSKSIGVKHNVLIDSGTTFIILDKASIETYMKELQKISHVECTIDFGVLACLIKHRMFLPVAFKPITIQMGNKKFVIPPYYIVNKCKLVEENVDQVLCFTHIVQGKDKYTILGVPFFVKNYVVFDQEKLQIGFKQKTVANLQKELNRGKKDPKLKHKIVKKKISTKHVAHLLGIGFTEESQDIEYLIYILVGLDIILLSIIVAFLWRKRYVLATGEWNELLEV